MHKALGGAALLALSAAVAPALAQDSMDKATHFKVRIENISAGNVLKVATGGDPPFAISLGMWAIHTKDAPVFTPGQKDRGKGLETQAEDGNPAVLAESLKHEPGVISAGVFTTPEGASGPAPAGPGQAFEFAFDATPGSRLTFTTMFGQSNDLFYAPGESGVWLFDKNKHPAHGDITWQVMLWDTGTEVNQEPGVGPDQAPRQKAPNTGAAENGVVQSIEKVKDGFQYPRTRDVLRVTITPQL
jgi:hypothetical protein